MWWKIIFVLFVLLGIWLKMALAISFWLIKNSWEDFWGIELGKYFKVAIFGGLTWPYWLPRFLKEYFKAGG